MHTENSITTGNFGETAWRDYADRLTVEQVELLSSANPQYMTEAELVETARDYLEQNAVQAAHAHIPAPAGAEQLYLWADMDEGVALRSFTGRTWRVCDDVAVRIAGEQASDGTIARHIELYSPEGCGGVDQMTPAQAREVAAALLTAAESIDVMNGDAAPFM